MSTPYQWVVIQHLKHGFWIQVTHDLYSNEVQRDVTNGEDIVMSVKESTVRSLLKKGVIEGDGTKFQLKENIKGGIRSDGPGGVVAG